MTTNASFAVKTHSGVNSVHMLIVQHDGEQLAQNVDSRNRFTQLHASLTQSRIFQLS